MDARYYDKDMIKRLREQRGSIRRVAKEMGVNHSRLHRAEQGDVTYDFLCEIAQHFNVPLKSLLYSMPRAA